VKINKQTGLIEQVLVQLSDNCDARPDKEDIQGIVIHNISLPPDEFGGRYIDDLFLNQLDINAHPYFKQLEGMTVSAHVLIRRDGEVVQFVPFQKRAWHAGISNWLDRDNCNDFTIGIELEGSDYKPFEIEQYTQLASLIKVLCEIYPNLNQERLTGHADIAPGRKTDPGPHFDWEYLYQLLQA